MTCESLIKMEQMFISLGIIHQDLIHLNFGLPFKFAQIDDMELTIDLILRSHKQWKK